MSEVAGRAFSAPMRLLVVEDDPMDITLIERMLAREFPEMSMVIVDDEREYARALEEGDFDVVITDLNLPWTDGLSVMRDVHERYPLCPVIMFTGTGSEETAVAAMKAGLDDYVLKKPTHFIRLSAAVRTALARRREHTRLLEIEERYRRLFDRIPVGLYRTTPDGMFVDANPAMVAMLGYDSADDLMETNAADAYLDEESRREWLRRMERDGTVTGFEVRIRRRDGTVIWVEDNARVARDGEGNIIYYEGSLEDITDRKATAEALRRAIETWVSTFDAIVDGVALLDGNGIVIQCNAAASAILDRPFSDIIGRRSHKLLHDDGPDAHAGPDASSAGDRGSRHTQEDDGAVGGDLFERARRSRRREVEIMERKGRWYKVTLDPILDMDRRVTGGVYIIRDITDQHRAEEKVLASLREKEILLKEIHHRVKNNMQVMSSMLNLQAAYVESDSTREMLREGQNRIKSMALIHEMLYQSEDLSLVDMEGYVRTLTNGLVSMYMCERKGLRLRVHIRDIRMGIDTAIPVGLIINELMSNALKHAFPDGRAGEITIRLDRDDGGYVLVVGDDGVGLPEDIDPYSAESMGLVLVNLLVDQLGGRMDVAREGETEFRIAFREG